MPGKRSKKLSPGRKQGRKRTKTMGDGTDEVKEEAGQRPKERRR